MSHRADGKGAHGSTPPEVRAVNLAELLRQSARRFPDRDAVVAGERRVPWRELDARVDAVAAALASDGLGPGDTVLVHSPNHIEFIEVMFAIWRIGATFAPTNFRVTPQDAAGLAEVCQPSAVICHVDYREHASSVVDVAQDASDPWWIGAPPDTERSIAGVPPTDRGPAAVVMPGDHAWYFFTSGTSGRPKAAVLTHEQMGFVVTNHLCDLMPGLTQEDAQVVVAPLSHGAGIHLLTQVARAAKTILPQSAGLDPAEVWQLVERERVSNVFTVPTILKVLTEAPSATEHDHSSLRYVVYAGAPMYLADSEHARHILGEVLVQYYGLGEVTGNITVLPPQEHKRLSPDGVEFGSCGYPRTGMQISIQDQDGREVGPWAKGEICVAGPAVCHGYLNDEQANAESFRDGWFHTSDLGMLDSEGYLYITGRASDMFISGGSNVYPREIEEKMLKHPQISEVAVLGMPDLQWGEVGVAICVPAPGEDLDTDEIREFLKGRLASYKVPKRVLVWQEIPKSGYGKIVKRTLRELVQAKDRDQPPKDARFDRTAGAS